MLFREVGFPNGSLITELCCYEWSSRCRDNPPTPDDREHVVFITLEDETGHSNFVVMPDKFEEYRAVLNQSDYLIIRGIFEERGMLKALSFKTLEGFTAEVVSHNFR